LPCPPASHALHSFPTRRSSDLLFAAGVRLRRVGLPVDLRASRLRRGRAGRGSRLWTASACDRRFPVADAARVDGRAAGSHAPRLSHAPLVRAGLHLLGRVGLGRHRARRVLTLVAAGRLDGGTLKRRTGPSVKEPVPHRPSRTTSFDSGVGSLWRSTSPLKVVVSVPPTANHRRTVGGRGAVPGPHSASVAPACAERLSPH